jgi:hypothetical protein
MKALTISGAMAGFVVGAASSLWTGGTTQTAFWHATLAALGAGWLARWVGNVWFESLVDAMAEASRKRHEAEMSAAAVPNKK